MSPFSNAGRNLAGIVFSTGSEIWFNSLKNKIEATNTANKKIKSFIPENKQVREAREEKIDKVWKTTKDKMVKLNNKNQLKLIEELSKFEPM